MRVKAEVHCGWGGGCCHVEEDFGAVEDADMAVLACESRVELCGADQRYDLGIKDRGQ